MPYSEIVLDHFHAPRNMRVMEKPEAVGVAGEPGRGNFMVIYLRVEGERIAEASFQTHGCCPSIAAGSWLTERITGAPIDTLARWDEPAINEALCGLPAHKRHCSALAAHALANALERIHTPTIPRGDGSCH